MLTLPDTALPLEPSVAPSCLMPLSHKWALGPPTHLKGRTSPGTQNWPFTGRALGLDQSLAVPAFLLLFAKVASARCKNSNNTESYVFLKLKI